MSTRVGRRSRPYPKKKGPMRSVTREIAVAERAVQAYQQKKMQVCRFPGIGFPDQLRCILKYQENAVSMSGALTIAQVFAINSLYDPDNTGTGHQPKYYDQLTAVYNKYCVVGARVRVTLVNYSTTVPATMSMCYTDKDNSSDFTESIAESRWSKQIMLGGYNNRAPAVDMGWVSIPMLMGQKDIESDPNMYSATTANPADIAFFVSKAETSAETSNLNIVANYELWFDCIFKELGAPGESLTKNKRSKSPLKKVSPKQ